MPSTSSIERPASASAMLIASTPSWISLRPESFENSVAPRPTTAVLPLRNLLSLIVCSSGQGHGHRAGDVVTKAILAADLDVDRLLVRAHLDHLALQHHGVAGIVGRAEPDLYRAQQRL